jgi:hypothetical protein
MSTATGFKVPKAVETARAVRISPHLDRHCERLRARCGTRKAIIAPARKFLSIIYHTLKNKWVCEDFLNFVLAEATA